MTADRFDLLWIGCILIISILMDRVLRPGQSPYSPFRDAFWYLLKHPSVLAVALTSGILCFCPVLFLIVLLERAAPAATFGEETWVGVASLFCIIIGAIGQLGISAITISALRRGVPGAPRGQGPGMLSGIDRDSWSAARQSLFLERDVFVLPMMAACNLRLDEARKRSGGLFDTLAAPLNEPALKISRACRIVNVLAVLATIGVFLFFLMGPGKSYAWYERGFEETSRIGSFWLALYCWGPVMLAMLLLGVVQATIVQIHLAAVTLYHTDTPQVKAEVFRHFTEEDMATPFYPAADPADADPRL